MQSDFKTPLEEKLPLSAGRRSTWAGGEIVGECDGERPSTTNGSPEMQLVELELRLRSSPGTG